MYYDVSMEISQSMQVFRNREYIKPEFINNANYETKKHYDSSIKINCHTGTHVDAPLHMIEGGKDLSYLKIENLIRSVKVLDLTNIEESIEISDLKGYGICKNDFLLIKTKNSYTEEFSFEYIGLSLSAAKYLADMDISGVGIDGLSIGLGTDNTLTHQSLLSKEIIIIEGLRLKDIREGLYNMIALPLKILTLEGCPIRVILSD